MIVQYFLWTERDEGVARCIRAWDVLFDVVSFTRFGLYFLFVLNVL